MRILSRTEINLAACIWLLFVVQPVLAQTVSTTLQLEASNDPINVLNLNLSAGGLLGSDSGTVDLTGNVLATFELTNSGGVYDVVGVTLTGGRVNTSDVTFALNFGVSATTSGLAATPFTAMPPGIVTAEMFDAAEHGLIVDQGTVSAAGSTVDFANMPFDGVGAGQGMVTTSVGTPVPGFDILSISLALPVSFDENFVISNVPLVGTVNANLSGMGTMRASGTLRIPVVLSLACDADGDGDCEHDDIDAMYVAIAEGVVGGQFDFNADGTVTAADIRGWLDAASDPSNTALADPGNDQWVVGDVDLNGDVDSTDLGLLLNNFTSAAGPNWGGGDLNADLNVDSTDLGLLLNNFDHTSFSASAVPEPATEWLLAWFAVVAYASSLRRIEVRP